MNATLCDRCGNRIYAIAPAGSGLVRIYIDPPAQPGQWYEYHTDCAKDMTINDIVNGGTA